MRKLALPLLLLFLSAPLLAQTFFDNLISTIQTENWEKAAQLISESPQESEETYRAVSQFMGTTQSEQERQGSALVLNVIARVFKVRLARPEFSEELQSLGLLVPDEVWKDTALASSIALDSALAEPLSDETFEAVMAVGKTAMARLEAAGPLTLLAARTGNYDEFMKVLDNAVPGLRETITVKWSNERVEQAERMLEQSLGTPVEDTARQLLESARKLQMATIQQEMQPLLFSVAILSATGHHTAAIQLGEQSLQDMEKEGLLEQLQEMEYQIRLFLVRSAIGGGRPEILARHMAPARELAKVHGQLPGDDLTLQAYLVESEFALNPNLESYKSERSRLWKDLIEADPVTVDTRALTFWPRANRTLAAGYTPGSPERLLLNQLLEQDLKEVRQRAHRAWTAPLTPESLGTWNSGPHTGLLDLYLDLAAMARRAGDLKDAEDYLKQVQSALPGLQVKAEEINQLAQPRFLEYGVKFDASKGHFTRVRARYHEELGKLTMARAERSPSTEVWNSVLGDLNKAMELYELSKNRGPGQELRPLVLLLEVRAERYPPSQGIEELKAWLSHDGHQLDRSVGILSRFALGEMQALSKDWRGASQNLEEGLKAYESLLAELGPRSLLAEQLRDSAMTAYDTLFLAGVEQSLTEKAMAALDRKGQAQAIYSLDVAASSTDRDVKKKLLTLQQSRQRLQGLEMEARQVRLPEGTKLKGAKDELGQARDDLQKALKALEGSSYARYLSIKPLQLSAIQASIPADTAIVQPAFRESGMVILVATSQDLKAYQVEVSLEQLEPMVSRLRQQILSNNPPGVSWSSPQQAEYLQLSSQLHQYLIEPIEESIKGKKVLAFVPSGPLHYLPFQSLAKLDEQGQPNFLIERHQVVTLCKAGDLEHLKSVDRKKEQKLTAFGNPDGTLPGAEDEVTDLGKLYPGAGTFLRDEANKENFLSSRDNTGILHLATHGILNSRNPRFSYLVLAGTGPESQLTFSDITGLGLKENRLVTLSACDTALGASASKPETKNAESEEFLVSSLAEAFTAAGSPTVLASLWKVDDEATRQLMTAFYEAMKEGLSPGEALQKAQVKLIKGRHFAHPFYWSPCVMWGDWR